PDSARLANIDVGASASVTVTYSVASVAAGTIDTLFFTARSVASPSTSANGRLSVTVLGYGTSVSPHATTTSNLPSNGTSYTASFTVQNVGNGTAQLRPADEEAPRHRPQRGEHHGQRGHARREPRQRASCEPCRWRFGRGHGHLRRRQRTGGHDRHAGVHGTLGGRPDQQ